MRKMSQSGFIPDESPDLVPWVGLLLVAASILLCFQLYPPAWLFLLRTIDVRTWTWRTTSGFCAVVCCWLMYVKARVNAS
jgi:hypothetical protein